MEGYNPTWRCMHSDAFVVMTCCHVVTCNFSPAHFLLTCFCCLSAGMEEEDEGFEYMKAVRF